MVTTLKERIQAELNDAMRARDDTRKSALRMLTAAVKNAEIEAGKPLDDSAVLGVVQKQVKQRRESIADFEKAGRADLVAKEAAEIAILDAYLPQQAERDEIERVARDVIARTGATTQRELGKVMPELVRHFAGRADGKAINEVVRGMLAP
jgi:uncharacterized protein YqeY